MAEGEAANIRQIGRLPDWVPDAVRLYLSHITEGQSLRAIARERGCHASTVLRQVRRFENRRDDPLVDEALNRLGGRAEPATPCQQQEDSPPMTIALREATPSVVDARTLENAAPRILPLLAAPGAILAIAPDMEKAVVMREDADGNALRTAIMDRQVAEAFALKEWIVCKRPGRVVSYALAPAGRAELARLIAAGRAAAASPVGGAKDDGAGDSVRRMRYGLPESPVAALARRRDRGGVPFLAPALVSAAERLQEDFELARTGTPVDCPEAWERLLADVDPADADALSARSGAGVLDRARAARARVAVALRELGPGLADMALRCCCYREGLETAERQLGWSARSGKIVLRIALQRLKRHYDTLGHDHKMIG